MIQMHIVRILREDLNYYSAMINLSVFRLIFRKYINPERNIYIYIYHFALARKFRYYNQKSLYSR